MPAGKPSDREVSADLLARLQRHYIKPGMPLPGGVFLPEVGWNGASNTSRADALYVGFTGTSGRMLIGHEIKASRADWLNELRKPGKADAWADQCHEWWLVSPEGIVHPGELPEGWGHLVPGSTTRTRMTIKTPAKRHPGRTPSWEAMRSIVARQDTLRAEAIERARVRVRQEEETARREAIEKAVATRTRTPDADATVKIREENERLLAMFGLKRLHTREESFLIESRSGFEPLSAETVAAAMKILNTSATMAEAHRRLQSRYALTEVAGMGEAIERFKTAYERLSREIEDKNP